MAIEIARVIPTGSRVLDFGCGNGFIAHHLSSILQTTVVGLDVRNASETPIEFVPFDGQRLPFENNSFDVVLFCYVLHHAPDAVELLKEARRVLRAEGLVIVYEDIPRRWWDRQVCRTHNLKWRRRTGPCTFFREHHWRRRFELANLAVVVERRLSRWRNAGHPVSRQFYLLTTRATPSVSEEVSRPGSELDHDHTVISLECAMTMK